VKKLDLNRERLEQLITLRAFVDLSAQIKHLKQTKHNSQQHTRQLQSIFSAFAQTLGLCSELKALEANREQLKENR